MSKNAFFCWKIVKIAERWKLRPQILATAPHDEFLATRLIAFDI